MKRVISRENHQIGSSAHQTTAIARWEDEGGVATSFAKVKVAQGLAEDEKILEYLGAAVIMRWGTLPTKTQRELFEHAASLADLGQTAELKGQIARFLHNHKDDGVRATKAMPRDHAGRDAKRPVRRVRQQLDGMGPLGSRYGKTWLQV